MHEVFISYSSKNKEYADAICHYLEERGTKCWYAPRDVEIGEKWAEAIVKAIRSAKIFILVFSEESNASKQVLREVTLAVEKECIIIPFKVDDAKMNDSFAYYLQSVHWLDAINKPLEKSLLMLADKVEYLLDKKPEPIDPKPDPIDPNPKPFFTLKKVLLFFVILWCIVFAGIFISSNFTKDVKPDSETKSIPLANTSIWDKYNYPFYNCSMFTIDRGKYFLKNVEDQTLALVKLDTGFVIKSGIKLEGSEDKNLSVFAKDDSNVVYFIDSALNTVDIYNLQTDSFVCGKIKLPIKENERVSYTVGRSRSLAVDSEIIDDLFITVYNDDSAQKCFSSIVHIKKDGSYEVKDISQYEIADVLLGFNESYEKNYLLIIDKENRLKIFDYVECKIVDIPHGEFKEICRNYLEGKDNQVSPNKRYVLIREGDKRVYVWDIETGNKVFSKDFVTNYSISFDKDSNLIYYNWEDNSVVKRNLENGSNTVLLDKKYFEDNFDELPYALHYSSKLDLFVFSCYEEVESVSKALDHVIVTDTSGKILYPANYIPVSTDYYNLGEGYYAEIIVTDDMFYYLLMPTYDGMGKAEEYDVNTLIYSARYSKDEDGNIAFSPIN